MEVREEVLNDRWPTLSVTGNAGYSFNRNDARTIVTYKGQAIQGGLRLSQKLYGFGRFEGRLRRAEAEIAEAEHKALDVRQEVLAEVAQRFVEQVVYGYIFDRRRAFEGLVEELEQVARERVALGTLDQTELYEIRRRLSRARAERIKAGSHARTSRARLARLTGGGSGGIGGRLVGCPGRRGSGESGSCCGTCRTGIAVADAGACAGRSRGRRVEAFREADLWPDLTLDISAGSGRVVEIETLEVRGGVQLAMALYEGGRKRSRLRGARSAVETARHNLIADNGTGRGAGTVELGPGREPARAPRESFEAAIADARTVADLTRVKLDAWVAQPSCTRSKLGEQSWRPSSTSSRTAWPWKSLASICSGR